MKKTKLGFIVLLVVIGLFFSVGGVEATYTPYIHSTTLKLGMKHSQVLALQKTLNSINFTVSAVGAGSSGNETDYFGTRTKLAVIAFQKSKGLVADGVVGPKTGQELNKYVLDQGMLLPPGCTSKDGFSTTTGARCDGIYVPTCAVTTGVAPLGPRIEVITPNGGQVLKTGETHTIKWLACNAPQDSWVKLTYTYPGSTTSAYKSATTECIASAVPSSDTGYNWKLKDYTGSCSDALSMMSANESFQTKINAQLYTGTPACEGLVPGDDPCVTGTRTLHASDESNNYFTITN